MRRDGALREWVGNRWLELTLLAGFGAIVVWLGVLASPMIKPYLVPVVDNVREFILRPRGPDFDGRAAFRHAEAQMKIGPRETGSEGSRQTAQYISKVLQQNGWAVEYQTFTYRGAAGRNIIARAGQGRGPVAIIGAHYDTRLYADNDPDSRLRQQPVPGANDGASGVAVLLELSRSLDKTKLTNEVWLVFFDAEDNGRINGWEFIAGSTHMAENLTVTPAFVVIADMVGDKDLQLYKEKNSTPALVEHIWQIAAHLGYSDTFLPTEKYSMIDDHTPFLRAGIPAVDIIDFDYPYWHTTQDTLDKLAPESLKRVGRVIEVLLEDGSWSAEGQ